MKKTVSGILSTLLLLSVVALVFYIQPVRAGGTIYIRSDGQVEGTDKIQRDEDVCRVASDHPKMAASSSTNVGGHISENTTWTLAGSPYIAVGDVIVESNAFLTIEPGVVVKFTNGTSLVIDGGLIARGNSTHKIAFTSNATMPTPGNWGKIVFRGLKLVIDHADIEYADTGISVKSGADSLNIANSTISKCRIGIREWDDALLTTYNVTIRQNLDVALLCRAGGSSPDCFTKTKIVNNEGYGIYAYGSFALSDSEVSNNSHWGIYLMSGTAFIINSGIRRNEGYGIYGDFNATNSDISYNYGTGLRGSGFVVRSRVTGNEGDGIEIYSDLYSAVRYNHIYNNTGYDLRAGLGTSGQDFNVTHNWWGTTNDTLIEEHIYDYYDDYDLGEVFYKPFLLSPYFVTIEEKIFYVDISSNSTITNFSFNQTVMQIAFDVTGESGTTGYCNATIPKSLLKGDPWIIQIDGTLVTDFDEKTNDTHTFLYFTYTHESPLQVTIEGTWVVPEFPSVIVLPLFMILSLITVGLIKLMRKKQ